MMEDPKQKLYLVFYKDTKRFYGLMVSKDKPEECFGYMSENTRTNMVFFETVNYPEEGVIQLCIGDFVAFEHDGIKFVDSQLTMNDFTSPYHKPDPDPPDTLEVSETILRTIKTMVDACLQTLEARRGK